MARTIFTNFQLLFNWLYVSTPTFPVKGDQVSILTKPDEFYDSLVNRCSQATSRIVLASLYLGTGDKEQRLVDTIAARANERESHLRVKILLDNFRGSRGELNSRQMILSVLEQKAHVQVALYRTPKLSNFLSKVLPQRYNELIGLQHMKIYVVDDDVMISGANLSHDYFTNRQDRCILIKDNKQIADFFEGIVSIVCDASLQVDKHDKLSVLGSKIQPQDFVINVQDLKYKLISYYSSFIHSSSKNQTSEYDTWIFPTIEIPPCDIHIDSTAVGEVLGKVPNNSKVHLASGYFNLNDKYVSAILKSDAKFDVLVAHPTANGFYQSNGLSGYIPDMYTCLTERFLQKIELNCLTDRVRIHEYKRPNWTFHGKGIWVTPPDESTPQLTVIGSSNYGARSQDRDLESQIIILTENENLRHQLHQEQQKMYQYSSPFNRNTLTEEKRLPKSWITLLVLLLKSYF